MALAPTTTYLNATLEQSSEVSKHRKLYPSSVQTITIATAAFAHTVGTITESEARPYSLVKVAVTAGQFASDATITLDKDFHQVGDVIEISFTPSDIPAARTITIADDASTPNTLATITATTDAGKSIASRKYVLGTAATWIDASDVPSGFGPVGSVDTRTGAGAISVTSLTTKLVTTGADALTLADGVQGQFKIIYMQTDGGDGTLTPATKTGYATITFNDARDTVVLQFLTTLGWIIVSNNGATVA